MGSCVYICRAHRAAFGGRGLGIAKSPVGADVLIGLSPVPYRRAGGDTGPYTDSSTMRVPAGKMGRVVPWDRRAGVVPPYGWAIGIAPVGRDDPGAPVGNRHLPWDPMRGKRTRHIRRRKNGGKIKK